MNVLSLFTGIGGLDLGLERAGMITVGQVEIDPWCRKVLAKHWPEVPKHDDVRTAVEWWGGRPAPDLVCGGFPCQPVSLAGKGLAQADSRWLWPAFHSVVRDLRPRYVLVENVPGLLGRGMGDVLGDLAAIGYDAEWDCVPAAFVGAPHIRNRVFVVAYPASHLRRAPGDDRPASPDRGDSLVAHPAHGDGVDVPGIRGALERRPRRRVPGDSGMAAGDVADASSPRPQGTVYGPPGRRQPARRDRHWATEPDVGRVAHGIPARVDRLRGLGNAVVPQVAEHIGRLIMTAAAVTA